MAPPGLAARIISPTLISAGKGAKRLMINAMTGKPNIWALNAEKNAFGCRTMRVKSESVSDKPTPNITSPKTEPTATSTKLLADKLFLFSKGQR